MDAFLNSLKPTDAEVIFFFPPYSALYWIKLGGKCEMYLDAKAYFIEKANEQGFVVYDFQAEDFIRDFDNYRDLTHYSGAINDWMTLAFAEGRNIVTADNQARYREKLLSQIEIARKDYADRL